MSFLIDQDVRSLQITIKKAIFMNSFKCKCSLARIGLDYFLCQPFLADKFLQISIFTKLHEDIEVSKILKT